MTQGKPRPSARHIFTILSAACLALPDLPADQLQVFPGQTPDQAQEVRRAKASETFAQMANIEGMDELPLTMSDVSRWTFKCGVARTHTEPAPIAARRTTLIQVSTVLILPQGDEQVESLGFGPERMIAVLSLISGSFTDPSNANRQKSVRDTAAREARELGAA